MKNLLVATVVTAILRLFLANDAEAVRVKKVNFESDNQNLVGNLYYPEFRLMQIFCSRW